MHGNESVNEEQVLAIMKKKSSGRDGGKKT